MPQLAVILLGAVLIPLGYVIVRAAGAPDATLSSSLRFSLRTSSLIGRLLLAVGCLLIFGGVIGLIFWGNRGEASLPW